MTTELKNKNKGFFYAQNDLLDKWLRIIGPGAFIVYLELIRFCPGSSHIPFPTVTAQDWAAWIGISYPSFLKHINSLEQHGLIQVHRARNKSQFVKESHEYEILPLPEITKAQKATVEKFPEYIRFGDPVYDEPIFRNRQDSPYKNSLLYEDKKSLPYEHKNSLLCDIKKVDDNNRTDKSNSTIKKNNNTKGFSEKSFDPEGLPVRFEKYPDLVKAWEVFVQHRKDIKKPLTKGAWILLAKKMLRHTPEDIVAELNQAIERGWRTIFYNDKDKASPDLNTSPSQSELPDDNSEYGNMMGIKDKDFVR